MLKKMLLATACFMLIYGCAEMREKRAMVLKAPTVSPDAQYVDSETCLECHEDYAHDGHNVHMKIADFESATYRHGCESCHGAGSIHADSEDPADILRYGKEGMSQQEISAVCVTCHQSGEQMNWSSSEHVFEGLSCTSCHTIHHNTEHKLIKDDEISLCVSCHQNQKAKMHFPSHHPLKEGKMTCDSCHNPHGSVNGEPGMLKTEERLNDLCFECHARYQGPFVFEHAPVAESCLECHDPHGTVANNLLKQNEPFICLQCHEGHFHAGRAGKTGLVTEYKPGKTINGTLDAYAPGPDGQPTQHFIAGDGVHDWAAGMLTKCTTCHQSVHGSDVPAQAGALKGKALTR
ncbi:MAG: DmsE family decaheme c-type cytochrome [Desulfobulbaceae bacterium]|nr:DmsE family decaheme c-type cytochrome [Desulfobulbaceae bacterium]